MSIKSMAIDEKRWRAESDARSLATAAEVQNDSARMKAAQAMAKKMAVEKEKELAGMRKAAGGTKPAFKPKPRTRTPTVAKKRY